MFDKKAKDRHGPHPLGIAEDVDLPLKGRPPPVSGKRHGEMTISDYVAIAVLLLLLVWAVAAWIRQGKS